MAEIKQNQMTQEGYDELVKELDYLRGEKRKEVAEKIKVAKSYGDLSENSEYDDARNEQQLLERRISVKEEALKNAVIVQSEGSNKKVMTGHKVKIEDQKTNNAMTVKIVGPTEANPNEGSISNESPIGKGLLEHKKGEVVTIETPGGIRKYKIISISK